MAGGDGRGGRKAERVWLRYIALLFAIAIVVVVTGSRLEAKDDGLEANRISDTSDGSPLELSLVWGDQHAIPGEVPDVRRREIPAEPARTEEPLSEPVPPEPTPAHDEVALTEVESVICGVFVGYCADALAVARCESGPDYYAPGAVYHTGTFQLAFAYHGDKFAEYGWNMLAEGADIYKNSVVAYEIFAGRGYSWLGTSGWPVCGLRAGY